MKKFNVFKKKETKRKVMKAFTRDTFKEVERCFKRLDRLIAKKKYIDRIDAAFQFSDDAPLDEVFNDFWKAFVKTVKLEYGFPIPDGVEVALKSVVDDVMKEEEEELISAQ